MKIKIISLRAPILAALFAVAGGACGGDDDTGTGGDMLEDSGPTVEGYAQIARATYQESIARAEGLSDAIDALVATPSDVTLEAARVAWLGARAPYGQSEAFRFYDGPIDDPVDGPEGRINAWPLDEQHIDYVAGMPEVGIINRVIDFPLIDRAVLVDQSEFEGEKNVSTGYHAIEFLLWGQDTSETGPGERPFTDYVADGGGTADNQERRGVYLQAAATLLLDDLRSVEAEWAVTGETYGATFVTRPRPESVQRILQGMAGLASIELSGERMVPALANMDQEDEHSCFSDNTDRDLIENQTAIVNVYFGRFGSVDVAGVDVILRARDPVLADRLEAELAAASAALDAIPPPFDQAIVDPANRALVQTAIDAIQTEGATIAEVAELLGLQVNLE